MNQKPSRIAIGFIDNSSLQGPCSYHDLCINTNIINHYKPLFINDDKENMLRMYLERLDDFNYYVVGDLINSIIEEGYHQLCKHIYKPLSIPYLTDQVHPTVSATVSYLVENYLMKILNLKSCRKTLIINLKQNYNKLM